MFWSKGEVKFTVGAVVSTVMANASEGALAWPDWLVCIARIRCTPADSAISVLQVPLLLVMTTLLRMASLSSFLLLPLTSSNRDRVEPLLPPDPEMVNPVVLLVMLSLLEVPVSSAAESDGADGTPTAPTKPLMAKLNRPSLLSLL